MLSNEAPERPQAGRGGGDIPASVIDQIKQRVDIIEVVGRHVELKRAGGALFKGLCPFHTERSPSFTVTPTRQSYHCFGCGAHGDAVQFLMEMEGMSFRETIEDMAQSAGVAIPAPDPSAPASRRPAPDVRKAMHLAMDIAADRYSHELAGGLDLIRARPDAAGFQADSARYVHVKRGIHQTTIERFRIGLAPEGWDTLKGLAWPSDTFTAGSQDAATTLAAVDLIRPRENRESEPPVAPAAGKPRPFGFPRGAAPAAAPSVKPTTTAPTSYYDTFRARLIFPVRDTAGKIVAFGGRRLSEESNAAKYLNSAETPIFHKSHVLYGLFEAREAIRRTKRVHVVEGYMDVVMLAQYGVENAVASMGTAMTESQLQTLLRFTECVIFVFDGDAAGQKAARKAAETVLPLVRANHDIRILTLPDGQDPDEFVRTQGREAFDALVESSAKSLSFFLRDQLLEECGGAKTPEQRARFQQRFQQILKLMTGDQTLAREYWKMFQQTLTGGEPRTAQPSAAGGASNGFRRPAMTAPARTPVIGAAESSIVAKLRDAVRLAPEIALQVRESIIELLDREDPAELRLQKDLDGLDDAMPAQRAAEGTPEWLFARDALLSHADLFEGHRKEQVRAELKAQRASGQLSTTDYIRELRELR
ncbi:CHC2 zinc finger domain-containing protein [Variovorax sp. LjRoot290]|uniref:DNA primase n=1 Tax=Variovorax sp. LjRoot290 TaxID=3342316 RepID=UPI003ECF2767